MKLYNNLDSVRKMLRKTQNTFKIKKKKNHLRIKENFLNLNPSKVSKKHNAKWFNVRSILLKLRIFAVTAAEVLVGTVNTRKRNKRIRRDNQRNDYSLML